MLPVAHVTYTIVTSLLILIPDDDEDAEPAYVTLCFVAAGSSLGLMVIARSSLFFLARTSSGGQQPHGLRLGHGTVRCVASY